MANSSPKTGASSVMAEDGRDAADASWLTAEDDFFLGIMEPGFVAADLEAPP
jgi:hypothetical protein